MKKIINYNEQSDWEKYYTGERSMHIKPKAGMFDSYDIYLCDYLLQKYVPRFNGRGKKPKITEIGSGDGKLLKKFAKLLNMDPLGIEYSKEGAKMARKNGVKTVVADAFDPKFLKKYKNHFDFVFSYGFVEHIIPPQKATQIHLDILKSGGIFMIQIPRFKGFSYWKVKIFRPEQIPLHNLKIMEAKALEKACMLKGVEKIYCQNYGTLKLRFPMDQKNIRFYILKGICYLDYILNPAFRILFGERGFETALFSPAVMFIGRKK